MSPQLYKSKQTQIQIQIMKTEINSEELIKSFISFKAV